MVKKIYYLELEKQRRILDNMIKEGKTKEEILKQSQKLDELINKVMFEGYN